MSRATIRKMTEWFGRPAFRITAVGILAVLWFSGPLTAREITRDSRSGGEFSIGLAIEIKGLDSQAIYDIPSLTVVANIQEALYEKRAEDKYLPVLAAGEPEITSDDEYFVPLRKNIVFHDGSSFSSEDVVFTFRRLVAAETKCPTAERFRDIRSIRTDGRYGIRVKTGVDATTLMDLLSRHEMFILSEATVKKYGPKYGEAMAVGTGPFRLKEWAKGEILTLEGFKDYWLTLEQWEQIKKGVEPEKTASGETEETRETEEEKPLTALPFIRRIHFKIAENDDDLVSGISRNRYGLVTEFPVTKTGETTNPGKVRFMRRPRRLLEQIYCNTQKGPLSDIRLRRRIYEAVDRNRLVEGVFNGYAQPAYGHVPDFILDSGVMRAEGIDDKSYEYSGSEGLKANDDEEEIEVELIYTDEEIFRDQAAIIKEQLKKAKVDLKLVPLPKEEVFQRIYEGEEEGLQDFEAALEDYEDWRGGEEMLQFYEYFGSYHPGNKCNWENERFDDLLKLLKKQPKPETALKLEKVLRDELPSIPLCRPDRIWAYRTYVQKLEEPADDLLRFRQVWIYH